MKLNSECIYDVLNYLESNLTYGSRGMKGLLIAKALEDRSYAPEDVYYTIEMLLAEGFVLPSVTTSEKNEAIQNFVKPQTFKIPKCHGYNGKTVKIKSITLNGNNLLTSMTEPTTFEKVRILLSKGILPTSAFLAELAKDVALKLL